MNKAEVIRALVESGRAKDVLDFVEGESKYVSEASEGAPNERELRMLWVLVVHHLRFLVNSVDGISEVQNGKFFTSHPYEFERWLHFGAPGIADEDIAIYLKENPL